MKASRVARLERLARERPCPVCGAGPRSPAATARTYGLENLDPDERVELLDLLGAVVTPACGQCGRPGHDIALLSDDQRHRLVALLDKLLGEDSPTGGSAARRRSSA